jgi:hypothetical protein
VSLGIGSSTRNPKKACLHIAISHHGIQHGRTSHCGEGGWVRRARSREKQGEEKGEDRREKQGEKQGEKKDEEKSEEKGVEKRRGGTHSKQKTKLPEGHKPPPPPEPHSGVLGKLVMLLMIPWSFGSNSMISSLPIPAMIV